MSLKFTTWLHTHSSRAVAACQLLHSQGERDLSQMVLAFNLLQQLLHCTVKATMQCRGQLFILADTVGLGYMIAANCLRGGAGLVHSLRP